MAGKESNRNAPSPVKVWSLEDIQDLLDLLAGREITEFEMEQQGVKIRVRRGNADGVATIVPNGYGSSPGAVTANGNPGILETKLSPPAAAPEAAAESTEG